MSRGKGLFKGGIIKLTLLIVVSCVWAFVVQSNSVYAGLNPDGSAPDIAEPDQAIWEQMGATDSEEEMTLSIGDVDYVRCEPDNQYDIRMYSRATWLMITKDGTYYFFGDSNRVLLQVNTNDCSNVKIVFGKYDGDDSEPCKIEASGKCPGSLGSARSPIEIVGSNPNCTVTLSSAPGCYNHFSAYWAVPCIRKDNTAPKLIFDTEDTAYPGSIDAEAYSDAKRTSAIGCFSSLFVHNTFGNVVFRGGIVTAYGSRNNAPAVTTRGGGGPGIGADMCGVVDGITFEGTCDVIATAGTDSAAAIGTSSGELGLWGAGEYWEDVEEDYPCKNIMITGGKVQAITNYTGDMDSGAGIGGGAYCSLQGFTMTGGQINVQGGFNAAGIGGGSNGNGTGIVIQGGKVRAKGGASGIGSGSNNSPRGGKDEDGNWYGDCEVTIDQIDSEVPTDVEVDGGLLSDWSRTNGVGIGCWVEKYHYEGSSPIKGKKRSVIIRGGKVKASGNGECPGIGAGRFGYINNIEISGGDIEAVCGSGCHTSIGGGREKDGTTYNRHRASCNTIRISGGTIVAKNADGSKGNIGGVDYLNSSYAKSVPANVYITGGNIFAGMFRTTPHVSENGPKVVCNPIVIETFSLSTKTREKHFVKSFKGALSDGAIGDEDYGLNDVYTFPADHSYDPMLYFWLPEGHTVRAVETIDTLLEKGLDLRPADIRYFSGINNLIEQESKGYATVYPPFYFLFDENYDAKDLNAGNAEVYIGDTKASTMVNEVRGNGSNTFTPKYYSVDEEGRYPLLRPEGTFIRNVTSEHTIWTDSYSQLHMINKPGESPSYSRDDQGKWRYGIQLYAIWDKYELMFEGNKPDNASTQLSGSMDSEAHQYDETITLPDCGFTLPGYEFRGWSVKPAAETGDRIYRPGDQVKGTDLSTEQGGSVKLFAQWEPLRYDIVFDSGDANQGAKYQSAVFDEPGTLLLNNWSYAPYVFHGWTGDAFGSFYEDGAEFCNLCSLNEDGGITGKTLTAEWVGEGKLAIAVTRDGRPVEGLKEKFLFSDGTADYRLPLEFKSGSYVLDPKEGSLPTGSYTVSIEDPDYAELPEGKGSFFYGNEGVSIALEYNTVQVAKENDNVTEVFVAESETGQMVVPDHKKLFLSASVKDRYHFTGYTVAPVVLPDYTAAGVAPVWDKDPTVSRQTITVTGPVRLIAHGEPNTYTVHYDANHGSGSMADQSMTYDQAARLSVNSFGRPGYVFRSWNTKPDGTGTGFDDHAWINADNQNDLAPGKDGGKVTLYALWEPIPYGISYDLDGGRLPDGKDNPVTYTAESSDITLMNPEKKDYDFAGWTGTGLQKPTEKVTIKKGSTGDRTYKANWKLKEFKVTFDTNGGSKVKTQTVKIHQTAQKPSDPKKQGCTFKGWYADKSLTKAFDFNTAIEKNTTVYAKWSAKSIPVLLAQGEPSDKTNIRISWNKVPGTSKYLVYAARCGSDMQRITVTARTSFNVKKVIGKKGQWKKLKPHRAYKFVVVAADKNGNVLAISKAFHVITTNTMGKYANIKTIKANKKTVTLKKGKTLKLGAKYTLPKGKKHINKGHGRDLRFTSDNPQVLSVSGSGTIKAKDTGKVTIYIQDTCGKYCKTVVTVK